MRNFMKQKNKRKLEKVLIGTFWLIIWQLCAMIIDNSILFATPVDVVVSLWKNIQDILFFQTLGNSLKNIGMGFLLAFFCGVFLGGICYRIEFLHKLVTPLIQVFKAIPVASFVVILLILTGTAYLSVYVSFLVVFPGIYENTIMGLKSADEKMLEVAEIFEMSGFSRYFYIYRPALMPYLIGYMKSAVGMSLKSGVAAEVIGTPDFTIGERMYLAKVHLETADIFAWTAVIIFCSYMLEKGFIRLLEWREKRERPFLFRKTQAERRKEVKTKQPITAEYISKKYGDNKVIEKFSGRFESGKCYGIMGPSGVGKTTLLMMLAGLTNPDNGFIDGLHERKKSMVFQENRLFANCSALENVRCATRKSRTECREELLWLLADEEIDKPAKELSGGMQRRVEVCRAMAAESDVVYLDEPFSGLDEETRKKVIHYINQKAAGRILFINTHREEDVKELSGETIRLFKAGGERITVNLK